MTNNTALPHLRKVVWDYHFTDEELLAIFEGKLDINGGYNQRWLFQKLLQYYSWYTLLSFVPLDWLPKLLSEDVIKGLFPKSLQEKYIHASQFLSKHTIPASK